MQQTLAWTNDDPVCRRLYESQELNEVNLHYNTDGANGTSLDDIGISVSELF